MSCSISFHVAGHKRYQKSDLLVFQNLSNITGDKGRINTPQIFLEDNIAYF